MCSPPAYKDNEVNAWLGCLRRRVQGQILANSKVQRRCPEGGSTNICQSNGPVTAVTNGGRQKLELLDSFLCKYEINGNNLMANLQSLCVESSSRNSTTCKYVQVLTTAAGQGRCRCHGSKVLARSIKRKYLINENSHDFFLSHHSYPLMPLLPSSAPKKKILKGKKMLIARS